jgi:phage terminase large subunit
MFDCSPLFYDIFQSTEKVLINQGGTSSSKTYSIMQLLFYKAVTEQRSVITVVGESLPNLRKGAYRDAENIYADNKYLQSQLKFWNKSERIVYFTNGSLIEFVSFENEQSAKNGKRDYLFVNEANGITIRFTGS